MNKEQTIKYYSLEDIKKLFKGYCEYRNELVNDDFNHVEFNEWLDEEKYKDFLAGANYGQKTEGMKWVKASERLPSQATSNEFFIKHRGYPYICKCIAFKFVFDEGVLPIGNNILGKEHYKDIEWLDESTEQSSTSSRYSK